MCGYIDSVSGDVVVRQHMQHVYNEFLAFAPQIGSCTKEGKGGEREGNNLAPSLPCGDPRRMSRAESA